MRSSSSEQLLATTRGSPAVACVVLRQATSEITKTFSGIPWTIRLEKRTDRDYYPRSEVTHWYLRHFTSEKDVW